MFYIMLRQEDKGLNTTYSYLTVLNEDGTRAKKSFATIEEAQEFVQQLISEGERSLNSLIVVKGVIISATLTLEEESA